MFQVIQMHLTHTHTNTKMGLPWTTMDYHGLLFTKNLSVSTNSSLQVQREFVLTMARDAQCPTRVQQYISIESENVSERINMFEMILNAA